MLETVTATRYITPLREGGSLPAIVEADDGLMYVMKFVGAGQGPKALIAELIGGEIARTLGLNVPKLVFIELDAALARSEPHQEIQDLLQASVGLNLGLSYLPNAFDFNMLLKPSPSPQLASTIVWLDAYLTNVDRTPRNVNLLMWNEELWLIDHGAALYFHHNWDGFHALEQSHFAMIKDHTLISFADSLSEVNETNSKKLTPDVLSHIVEQIPDIWLGNEAVFDNLTTHRAAYVSYLTERLAQSSIFVEEAINAHAKFV